MKSRLSIVQSGLCAVAAVTLIATFFACCLTQAVAADLPDRTFAGEPDRFITRPSHVNSGPVSSPIGWLDELSDDYPYLTSRSETASSREAQTHARLDVAPARKQTTQTHPVRGPPLR